MLKKKKRFSPSYRSLRMPRKGILYDVSVLDGGEPGEVIPRLRNPKKHNPKLERKFDYENASLVVSRTRYVFGDDVKLTREESYWEKFKDPSSLVKFEGENFRVLVRTPLNSQFFYKTIYIQDFRSPEEAYQVALKVAQYTIRCLRFFFRWNSPFTISEFVVVDIKNKITRFYWAQVYCSKTCRH